MIVRLDDEIRALEARIARERDAMTLAIEDCLRSARDTLVAPQSLLAVAAMGFLLGAASKVRGASDLQGKTGLAVALLKLATSVLRARYGTPWALMKSLLSRRGLESASPTR